MARVASKVAQPALAAQRWKPMRESLELLALRGLDVGSGGGLNSIGADAVLRAWIAAHVAICRPLVQGPTSIAREVHIGERRGSRFDER